MAEREWVFVDGVPVLEYAERPYVDRDRHGRPILAAGPEDTLAAARQRMSGRLPATGEPVEDVIDKAAAKRAAKGGKG